MPKNSRKPVGDALKKDYSKLLVSVATKIKALRKKNKLSQEEFAEELEYATRFIQKLESGTYAPNLLTLTRVARYFGVTVSELLEE